MPNIAGIRLREAGRILYYDAADLELHVSDYVVVESSHGITVGRVVIAPDQVIVNENRDEVRPVLRLATQEDVERLYQLRERAHDDGERIRKAIAGSGLPMSLAGGEYDLSGEHFTAFFTAPERVDFRNLVRDLSRELGTRVQFVQVGDRDRAKLVDGVDICGERLCCSSWMTSFPSVGIRMAKEQDLPLNPQKISGVCGRLYCCLTFEYEDYKALRGTLPKVGSMVSTPVGEAKITGIDFVRERVKLYLTDQRQVVDMAVIDLQLQHGVTVRPMELVRRVEGPMRPIAEDSAARPAPRPDARPAGEGRRPRPVPRSGPPPARAAEGAAQTADRSVEQEIDAALRAGGRPRGRGRGGERPPDAGGPQGQASAPGTEPPPAGQPGGPRPGPEGGSRRRRRRRGRGGGPGGSGGPQPQA